MKPVVFLAFSNLSSAPLQRLVEEDDTIVQILHNRWVRDQHFHVHRSSHADVESLRRYLTEYRDQVIIFHFGGHAGSEEIFLSSGEAKANGLAEMLSEQQNLKLVFLNGCSTQGQVDQLLALGVPAVIATSAPVDDSHAMHFAQHFYHMLEVGGTIGESYRAAAAYLKTRGQGIAGLRDRVGKKSKETDGDVWGIYVHPDKEDILNQRLPTGARKDVHEEFEPNELLIKHIWQALIESELVVEGKKTKLSRKRMAILNSLPAPVAEHLRKLLVPVAAENAGFDKFSKARLEQLVRTYKVLVELLLFTLLAQLWELQQARKDQKTIIPPDTLKELKQFLHMNEHERSIYPLIPLIRRIRFCLDDLKVEYFIEELADLAQLMHEDSDFRRACLLLDLQRERIVTSHEIEGDYTYICIEAEKALATIFSELGYLARYTLATVKQIMVEKYRHTLHPSFRHTVVRLIDLLGGMEEEDEHLQRFLDTRSVLLLKEEEDKIISFLNLSPFIIDENAFVENTDISKIYFFHHYNDGKNSWCFRFVNKPSDPILQVPGKIFRIIDDQFQAFNNIFLTA